MGNPNFLRNIGIMGKAVLTEASVDVPQNVTITVKNKAVTVKGPLGSITKGFQNLPCLLRTKETKDAGKQFNIAIWFKNRKQRSVAKTLASIVDNMIIGVTKGYKYTMRYGFKRHPMKPITDKSGLSIKIENYLGSKKVVKINAPAGVKMHTDPEDKERGKEITVTGIDNELVGTTCALIHQSCRPHALDRRKFEDGLYIQNRGLQAE